MAEATKQQLEARLSRLRNQLKVSSKNAEAAGSAAGHELVFYGGLGAMAWASGYWGSDYLTFWGIDIRPLVGVGVQLAGLAALAWGMPAGQWAITIGRAPTAAWLAERARDMGARARTPEVGASTPALGQLVDGGHPLHEDIVVTSTPQLAY